MNVEFVETEVPSNLGGAMADVIDSVQGFSGWPASGGMAEWKLARILDQHGNLIGVGPVMVPTEREAPVL